MDFNSKKEELKILGSLGYSIDEIATFLELSENEKSELASLIEQGNNDIATAYNKGASLSKYKTDVSLITNAQKGDIPSINTVESRTNNNRKKELKKKLFGL